MRGIRHHFLDQWSSFFRVTNMLILMIKVFSCVAVLDMLISGVSIVKFANELTVISILIAAMCIVLYGEHKLKCQGDSNNDFNIADSVDHTYELLGLLRLMIESTLTLSFICFMVKRQGIHEIVLWAILITMCLLMYFDFKSPVMFIKKYPWRLLEAGLDERNYRKVDAALSCLRDINRLTPYRLKNTPLSIAIRHNDPQLVEYLMNKGAKPLLEIDGISILQIAAYFNFNLAYDYMYERLNSEREMAKLEQLIEIDGVGSIAHLDF